MLHERKRQSLLSWVQSAGGHDVTSFSQLYDGKLLNELVVTLADKDINTCKAEVESEDPVKPPETSVSVEQHELTKDIIDFSAAKIDNNEQGTNDSPVEKIEDNEQGVINGYSDSTPNELNSILNHSDKKTEDGNISENGITSENNEPALLNEVIMSSQETESDTTDVIDKSISDVSVIEHSSSVKNFNDRDVNISANGAISEIEGHYAVVQTFIDGQLGLKCMALVDFTQCFKGHELELSKLTVLLLSAMVQYSVSTDKNHIMATCYSLSRDDQEEIQDCLELFLKLRESPVELKEFNSRLARCAKLRISPRMHSTLPSTPQLNRPTRRSRKRKAYNNVEEEFIDKGFESPIQNLILSPYMRNITPNSEACLLKAVRCRDKKIELLTHDLDMEKYNLDDLKKENENLSSQLSKLVKQNKKLKEDLDEAHDNLVKNNESFEKVVTDLKSEAKNYSVKVKDLLEELKFYKEIPQPKYETNNARKVDTRDVEVNTIECDVQENEDKVHELQKEVVMLKCQVDILRQKNEDLSNTIKKNFDCDSKTNSERPSIPEKLLNFSDLSERNRIKKICADLKECLKTKDAEINKLQEKVLQKERCEKDCKDRLRKTDKEREDAINNLKKLESENSNLKGQIEVFKNIFSETSSYLLPKSSVGSNSNRRSSRNQNVCDSEKIGQLWSNYEDETDNSSIKTGFETDKLSSESSAVLPLPSEPKKLVRKVSQKAQKKLGRSQSVSNISSKESVTVCQMCSENDFYQVPPLIQNICKIVREDNILDTDVLLELHKYERDFDGNNLVRVLTLLTKIMLDGSSNHTHSKHIKKLSSPDLNSDINLEQVNISKANEPEQVRKGSSLVKTVSGSSSECPKLDAVSIESREISQKNDLLKQYRQRLKAEKKKIACLESELQNMKDLQSVNEEELKQTRIKLKKAEGLKKANAERCKAIIEANKVLEKNLKAMKEEMEKERPAPTPEYIVEPMPPPPCEKCPKLSEEIVSLQLAKEQCTTRAVSLEQRLNMQSCQQEDLKRELCRLNNKNNELEEKLSDPKIVSAGIYSPKLKSLREVLRESLYKDVERDSPETQSHDILTVTNCSFTVPSGSGFANNNRNQSQLRAFCKAEDEAEMLSQSSIFDTQQDSPNKRLKEINRRNTLCLPHLKSQYPLELNTTPTQQKYFQTPSCSRNMPTSDCENPNLAKKRKISSVCSSFASFMSKPSTSGTTIHSSSTPKVFKMHKSSTSAARTHYRQIKDCKKQC